MTTPDPLVIAGREFRSRLILGTGKYSDEQVMVDAFDASGTEMVTVALRRVNLDDLDDLGKGSLIDRIDQDRYLLLPNTAACYTADEAVRDGAAGARTGRLELGEAGGDRRRGRPSSPTTRNCSRRPGNSSPTTSSCCPTRRTIRSSAASSRDLGAAAVMPLAAPIGSGMGIRNPANLRIIVEQANVPVIVDAGVGTASDAALAMELGRGRRADEHRRRRAPGIRCAWRAR